MSFWGRICVGLVSICSFLVLSGQSCIAAQVSEDYYTIYESDYNNDGLTDLILVPKKRLLVIASTPAFPVVFSEALLILKRNSDGSYGYLYPASHDLIAGLTLIESNFDVFAGDFNGDGLNDLLFQAPTNGSQTFIVYSDHINDPPKKISYLGMHGVSQSAASISIRDMQGDGISDIEFTLNNGTTKFAFGGSSFIEAGDIQVDAIVPGAPVDPMFAGAFQVDESGAATYSLDIEVPPVPSGMVPDFGVSYSSNAGNGSLGIGWSLVGESAITRCPTTYVEDGYVDGVDFDDNDQFCLDGVRLILVSGTHGLEGAEYRKANDNAQRVFVRGTSGGGPLSFEVQSPKGAVTVYGGTSDSRVATSLSQVAIWSISENSNAFGDKILYSYNTNKSLGEHFLQKVVYGSYWLDFEYEERPDVMSGYAFPRVKSHVSKRIRKISASSAEKEFVHYQFNYGNNLDGLGSAHSYLTSINVCKSDGACKISAKWNWTSFEADSFAFIGDPLDASKIKYYDDYSLSEGDWNNDGLTDFLWQQRTKGHNQWFFANGDGSFHNVTSILPNASVDWGYIQSGDWNGDGIDDIVFIDPNSGQNVWYVNKGTHPISFDVVSNSMPPSIVKNRSIVFGDWNGDGITDVLAYHGEYGNNDWFINSGNANFSITYNPIDKGVVDGGSIAIGDWNGDGVDDFFWYDKSDGRNRWYINTTNWKQNATQISFVGVLNSVNPLIIDESGSFYFGDWNSDGIQDFMWYKKTSGDNRWFINDGTANFVQYDNLIPPSFLGGPFVNLSNLRFADWNGDGVLDLLAHNPDTGANRWFVGTGTLGFSLINYSVNALEVDEKCGFRVGDYDASGNSDFMCFSYEKGQNRWVYSRGHRYAVINKFVEPTGSETLVKYEALNKSSSYSREITFDQFVSTATPQTKIVTRVSTDNGAGGQQITKFKYSGYRSHNRGYGSLGFRKLESIDTATGIRTVTEYSQDFANHTVGMVNRAETWYVKDGQNRKLNETVNTNLVQSIQYGDLFVRMPYLAQQEVSSWDFVTGELIGTVSAGFSYDTYGNLLLSTTTTTDPVSGEVFESTKSTEYYPAQESPIYFVGLPRTITSTSNVPGSPETGPLSATRKTYFEYNSFGAPTKQVVEPGHAKALTTAFEYNAAGQVTFTRVSAAGLPTKVSEARYYDTGPQSGLEYQQVNALGHTTTFYYENPDYPWLRTRAVDANGRVSKTYYDAWGRAPTVEAADGTTITQQTFWCDENCEEGELYYSKTTPTVGKPSYVFFDKQGREIRKSAYGFDGTDQGRLVHVRTDYNAIGKVARHSEPHFDGDAPQWNQTWYDDLGRPQIAYDSSGNPMTYVHLGRTVMSTNALGQSKTVETNAQGQTIRVTDAIGKDIEYAYGPFGELIYTRDSDGVITRAQYDIFGNKIAMQDPDKGSWTYEYDAYGQLIKQTDARGWVTFHEYDILGRLTKRVDRYGTGSAETSTWQYDLANLGTTGRKALGMVNRVAKGAFIETYQYDNLGRPTITSTTIDAVVWNSSTTYDAYSRPLTMSYPGGGLVLKNEYHPVLGMLHRIKNNSTNAEYWELQETNARGQASLTQLGNLMLTSNTFNQQTGYLESIVSYVPGQATNLQEMSFNFDAIGNLKVREEYQTTNGTSQLVTETLTYDNLNRLTESHVVSPLLNYYNTLTYQDNGNIQTKSEVGTYTYGGTCNGIKAGPHAVTQIVGQKNAVYCYDHNGNMLSGDSRTITYTTQDVPKKITKGSNSVEFFYGPNQERYKRIDVEGGVTTTTISIGAYERIKSGSDTTYKYYVGGFAVVSKKNSEAQKTQYLLKDHQGSVVAAVDSLGAVVERMSFDAWGKRRSVTWEGMSDTSLFAYKSAVTNRGYTGHEHVDSMGLIHMNGRVYDPVIGRFLSADPFVQDATNSQSLNRYSYVMNNPLSMTDPSGFFWKKIKKAFKKIAKAVTKAIKAVVSIAVVGPYELVAKYHIKMWKEMARFLAKNPEVGMFLQAAACATAIGCVVVAFAVSALTTYGLTGDLNAALRAGVTSAAVAAVSFRTPLSSSLKNVAAKSVVDAAMGHVKSSLISGGVSALQGGSFKDGFNSTFEISSAKDYLKNMVISYLGSSVGQRYMGENGGADAGTSSDGCSTSRPIEIRTGRKFLVITDLQTGRLKFVRHYNSFANEPSSLGGKWRHEYEKKLVIDKDSPLVFAVRGDGQSLEFNIDPELNKPTKAKGRFNETLKQASDQWQLTNEDDSIEIYDANGTLQSIVERDGYTQTLHYSKGKLVSISDSDNRRIDLRYDYRGMLVEITNTSGHSVGYRYNVFDALVSVRMPDGTPAHGDNPRVTYLYEDSRFLHALTGLVDESGKRFGTWNYDEQMRAFYEHTEGQLANRLEYLDGDVTNLTDALGRTTTYHFNERGQPELVEGHPTASCIGSNNQYEYDDNGFLKSKTDWNGNRTEFTHNDRGLETSRTEAAGTAEAYTVKTEWHDVYRLPVRVEKPGTVTQFAYDESGQLLEKVVTDTTTTEHNERTWKYSYNAKRQLVQVDGPRTDVADITRFEYDVHGNQTAVINALQHHMRVLESNADGLPTLLQDQNGTQTRLTYNARGWLTEKATHLENGEWAAITFDYTGIGAYEGTGLIKAITQPNGARLSYEYNAARQVVAITKNAGERIDYQLDTMGNRVEEITRDASGQIRREKRAIYDELSRLLQSIGADGNATHFAYDANGNVTDMTDALARNTRNAYDALNRLISSVDALDGETQTAYNEQGQVEQVTDARGIVTRYDYNGFGEVTKLTSQDTGITTYAYDSAGNKVEQRNANGIVTRYRYDALNRLQAVEYPSSQADNIAYQYDVATLNAVGRVAKVQDQTGATERAYDKRGNVVQEVRTIGTNHYAIGYEYDTAGNMTAMTYPNGVTIRYQQDASGRVARISRDTTLGDNTLLDNIRYLPFGPVSSLRYGNGLTDQREHDRDYRLQQQRVADLYRKTYQYDPVGNITAILDQQQAANDKHYEYDELNRLTVASTGLGNREQFDYDAVGNRIAYQQVANGDVVQQQAYEYADTSNRLLAVNQGAVQRSFQYDNAGNTVKDSGVDGEKRALEYGANNRLQLVAKDGLPTARYQHNAQGQRVIKVVNGEETHFIYDINDRLIAEANGNGQILRQYVYLGREPMAMQDAANDQWYFVHNDHLGTPKLVTDTKAQVVWRGEAKAFGETQESGALTFAFRFPGQFEDGESGYFYNYFRDYDASVGRYLQSDPIGLEGGMNSYSYVGASPLGSIDPYGLFEVAYKQEKFGRAPAEVAQLRNFGRRLGDYVNTLPSNHEYRNIYDNWKVSYVPADLVDRAGDPVAALTVDKSQINSFYNTKLPHETDFGNGTFNGQFGATAWNIFLHEFGHLTQEVKHAGKSFNVKELEAAADDFANRMEKVCP
jgi:RHS repeat-associated protein